MSKIAAENENNSLIAEMWKKTSARRVDLMERLEFELLKKEEISRNKFEIIFLTKNDQLCLVFGIRTRIKIHRNET